MNIYLISQTENNDYDTYDSACVAAPDLDTARNMSPSNGMPYMFEFCDGDYVPQYSWASRPDNVKVELVGTSESNFIGVICASFNAG